MRALARSAELTRARALLVALLLALLPALLISVLRGRRAQRRRARRRVMHPLPGGEALLSSSVTDGDGKWQ